MMLPPQSSEPYRRTPSSLHDAHVFWVPHLNADGYSYSSHATEIPSASVKASSNHLRPVLPELRRPCDSVIDLSALIPLDPEAEHVYSTVPLSSPSSRRDQYTAFSSSTFSLWDTSAFDDQESAAPNSRESQHQALEYIPYRPASDSSSRSTSPPSYTYPSVSAPFTTFAKRPSPPIEVDEAPPSKSCFHCHVTSTPLWRRDPSTQHTLCNACGLYLQQRNRMRPQELIDADIDDDDETYHIPDAEWTGPRCTHCLTRRTSVWRRSKTGAQVCNACGVYAHLRGRDRPLSLRRNKIKPRTKHPRLSS
ncbi:GATA zinc finger domain-containing protein [Mycena venus]|uniref:GATA zinc finger domain-containing protein n=1 Tax=Mycena venus TaxID=2733690 RepID=A0A8H6XEF1_9AGAR|nr:GATA zinc finger domain-containing protein [Mycena venus]